MTGAQDELAGLIARHAAHDGLHATRVPRLFLIHCAQPTMPIHILHEPALCIVASGAKRVMLGDRVYPYDRAKYLVVSVEVPIVGQVVEASLAEPYLCLRLDLAPRRLAELMINAGHESSVEPDLEPGLGLASVTPALLDAAVRLLRLLDTPDDIPVLGPMVEREILYRLLTGAQGRRLRQIALTEGSVSRVSRAISWIKRHYTQTISIEQVAAAAAMSPSALHHHFKAVTALSPLQYQKQLRLQEARRLMLLQAMDAASAGHQVGYDSPSQFSREYNRLFGAPPLRDAARLRQAVGFSGYV